MTAQLPALEALKPLLQQAYLKKRGRPGKPKPVFVSRKIELDYARELLAISRLCQAEADRIVIPEVSSHLADSWFGDAMAALRAKLKAAADAVAEALARKTANAQKKASDQQLKDQLNKLTGIDLGGVFDDEALRPAVEEAIAANVALIKSIPSQYADKLESIVMAGIQAGKPSKAVMQEIKALGQSTDNRARLIAVDQLGKINSRITQMRQQSIGITHYTWSTSHDERVRHSHRLRDGEMFAWNDPPADGHPGQPIRCRCVALPYLDHLVDAKALKPEQILESQKKRNATEQ